MYLTSNTALLSNFRFTDVLQVYSNRYQRIMDHCNHINKSAATPPRSLLYSKRLNLVYCPVPFTDSSLVKVGMMKAEGERDPTSLPA